MSVDPSPTQCRIIWMRLAEGRVIPFLGAGANLCDRPEGADWLKDEYLPSGAELAGYLAERFGFPRPDTTDLVRVSQYVDLVAGEAALFDTLRALFTSEYKPNRLHRFLAELPDRLGRQDTGGACPLIITTNYDDALERAFVEAGEPFDLVQYAAERDRPGRLVHVKPDGKHAAVSKTYRDFALGERTVIVKIHGAVDRSDERGDSFVITEDHYIDYLALTDISRLVPTALMSRMRQSHFLFLGYGMRDWNLRVILHHIWAQQPRAFASWAIQRNPDPMDEKFWRRHNVELVDVRLEEWVDAMRREVR
jgi:hypothetical protein